MTSDRLRDGNTASALMAAAAPTMNAGGARTGQAKRSFRCDDLLRDVYGVLGIPVDATDLMTIVQKIKSAAASRSVFFLSTVNLNYLVTSQTDERFRESLLRSGLCSADGMPVVWIARMLGVPIKHRVAGSDLIDMLRAARGSVPLKIFLFGGDPDAAAAACEKLNADRNGLICVGSFFPGFGTVDEMSTDAVIKLINDSEADFLAVALGARKGQAWLLKNDARLQIPVRAHVGAAINFQAGTVERAPPWMRQFGLEWLWRILQEPLLWRRYYFDGLVLVRIIATRVLPLIGMRFWDDFRFPRHKRFLRVGRTEANESVVLSPVGFADTDHIDVVMPFFQEAMTSQKRVVINFAGTHLIDTRFLGLLLMLEKCLKGQGHTLTFEAVPPRVRRFVRFNGFGFLLCGVAKA
jgi:N-acetylglucosaminyldiphosphoundecaprenol N-acetyl-beta-D-mannosaminyltransferase